MKKNIKIFLINLTVLCSFIYAGSVTPILGLRFNDVLGSNDLQDPTQSLGLRMQVGDNVYSGFDVSNLKQVVGTMGVDNITKFGVVPFSSSTKLEYILEMENYLQQH